MGFWESFLRDQFIKQIDLLYDSIQNRLLPTFNDLEKEAKQVAERKWDELCSSCYSPDIDPGDLAEKAQEAGIEHYTMLSNIKQTILNLTATALYHLFEQQIIFFLRREILHPSQEDDPQLMKISIFKKRVLEKGINIDSFRSWAIINELRFVANSIKHAEGPSVVELHKLRPDLFEHPIFRTKDEQNTKRYVLPRVYLPLAGEDIFITPDDLLKYKNAIRDFWDEFINICLNYEEI
ncbi:hypothetical protein [Dissulfuribacter thermophilus]|nr:hypothetical protein [Dissulfuribacter thermophilus]